MKPTPSHSSLLKIPIWIWFSYFILLLSICPVIKYICIYCIQHCLLCNSKPNQLRKFARFGIKSGRIFALPSFFFFPLQNQQPPLHFSNKHKTQIHWLIHIHQMGMAAAAVAESQFHVLAVDDSIIDRKLIERLLKTSSYQGTYYLLFSFYFHFHKI